MSQTNSNINNFGQVIIIGPKKMEDSQLTQEFDKQLTQLRRDYPKDIPIIVVYVYKGRVVEAIGHDIDILYNYNKIFLYKQKKIVIPSDSYVGKHFIILDEIYTKIDTGISYNIILNNPEVICVEKRYALLPDEYSVSEK